jgi:tRNA-guanine family transglycosylase
VLPLDHPLMVINVLWVQKNQWKIQKILNSDIAMIFDECTPYPATFEEAEKSMQLKLMGWAYRSKDSI